MAVSQGYRPMLEKEWKPDYKVPYTDLVVVDYDTHPRYARGTVLTKSGTPIVVTGDRWRNRPVGVEPISAASSPDNEGNSPGNDAGLPDNDPQTGLPEPTIVRYYAYQSDGNGGWLVRTSFGSMQTARDLYGEEIDKGLIRIAVEKSIVEWAE